MESTVEIKLSRRKLRSIANDASKSASAVDLVYVNDQQEGILRIKKNGNHIYEMKGREVTDKELIARIKALVIPPAWERVWICKLANGHLQATGFDIKNRKQYIYHPTWNILRNQTKYYHLYEFGKTLPTIREKLQHDIARHDLPPEKILATIVSLMQYTSIRIGSSAYEKLYGSIGLTTLKNKHVQIHGTKLQFSFIGKKGVHHDITVTSKRLAKILQQCKDIPGKELFQYFDESGAKHAVDSGMVNNYIKEISGGNFTAKDFRTWAGTLHAIEAFKELGEATSEADAKRKINEALDIVAKQLGNTRSVCKKYYVHPAVIELYSNNKLSKFFSNTQIANQDSGLNVEEEILMKILDGAKASVITA